MNDWKKIVISPTSSIIEAVEKIDRGEKQFALVLNNQGQLEGTVTDGDVRRGLLKGITLQDKVELIMNSNPIMLKSTDSADKGEELMKIHSIKNLPVVNESNVVIDVISRGKKNSIKPNKVVLMAGGLGSRLGELTKDCPKPLLKVGKKPILETITEGFIESGFRSFYFSVNYKSQMIKEYFDDGSKWGVNINYIDEEKRLGTAGGLSFLNEKVSEPIIVMNGDLLTKINFEKLLEFHHDHNSLATMCVREYDFQIPYGVVKVDEERIVSISEKPVQKFFVNAGVYVLDPEVLSLIPQGEYFDMTTLFNNLINNKSRTCVFPIREYWLDIGQIDDFKKANGEYGEQFE